MNNSFIKESHKRLIQDTNQLIAKNKDIVKTKALNDYLLALMIALSLLD